MNTPQCAEEKFLDLGKRFSSLFRMPAANCPELYVLGGRLDPREFGIEGCDEPFVDVAGKGLTQRDAFFGCVGEGAEHLSILEWPEDTAGRHEIRMNLKPAEVDPVARKWIGSWLDPRFPEDTAGIEWIPFEALDGGDPIFLPLEFAVRRPEKRRRANLMSRSNGCAAGATLETATLAAMCELVERDCYAIWWFGGQNRFAIPQSSLEEMGVWEQTSSLRAHSSRLNWFVDLTSDLQIPCIAALSSSPVGDRIAAGFAVDTDPARAVVRALLELSQMEVAMDLSLDRLSSTPFENLSSAQQHYVKRAKMLTLAGFPGLRPEERQPIFLTAPPEKQSMEELANQLAIKGFSSYRLDLTREAIEIPVVRMVIPGLQSPKMEWITPRLANSMRLNKVDTHGFQPECTLF